MWSESVLLWVLAAAVVGAIVLPYVRQFRRRHAEDVRRKAEAERLGIDQPVAQYPYIDISRCVGCAACVDACPEGDVLGVVRGTATVINAFHCVGHARCEEACPVSAIEVGVGHLKSRRDTPWLNDDLETSVPGVFVAGELGGLALIRNAVAQGQRAATAVARRINGSAGSRQRGVVDLAIVGAGPAGIAAALTARAHGLSFEILEREDSLGGSLLHYPRRKMVLTEPVTLAPWGTFEDEEYSKESLVGIFEEVVERFDLPLHCRAGVQGVDRVNGHFAVRSEAGEQGARTVLLATGRRGTPRKLGVPGEHLPKVMYKLLDAESYEDRKILIVGGGDSAAEAAIGLSRQRSNEVHLAYRRDALFRVRDRNAEELERRFASGRVIPHWNSSVEEIREDSVRLGFSDGRPPIEIANDFVFVFAGGTAPVGFLQSIGVQLGPEAAAAAS